MFLNPKDIFKESRKMKLHERRITQNRLMNISKNYETLKVEEGNRGRQNREGFSTL